VSRWCYSVTLAEAAPPHSQPVVVSPGCPPQYQPPNQSHTYLKANKGVGGPSSTKVPANLALRYPCCYAFWNTRLSPVGSGTHSHWAQAWGKY
jgi:hypothetical protein